MHQNGWNDQSLRNIRGGSGGSQVNVKKKLLRESADNGV